ncbi:Na/Pi symporter [Algirhabdus cladophorae]|uniref:Na/Pi symporter n=1 Tax=Algirhabdus cladophorae TaxID=3377108 RepID=UPI003B847772
MDISTIAGLLAGFGLFFVGVWTLTESLKQLSGRRLRQAVLKYTRRPIQGLFWGAIAGAMAQSLSAMVFILVGMISAGILSMRVAIPILAGANVGSSLLVFLSTINLDVAVLILLGVSGIVMTLFNKDWLRPMMHGLFGLGLLFLGISFIQTNAAPLAEQPWIAGYFTGSGGSFVTVFLLGALMCILAQSMGAVTILAISLGQAGVLTVDMTILAIYGAQFGSGVVTYILSVSLRGSIRQIAMYQIISTNVFGTTLFVGLWIAETFFGVPLVKALLGILANDLPGQMAFLYLVLCVPIVSSVVALTWVERSLARVSPPTQTERDGQPQHIIYVPVADVDAALDAAQLDQNRLVDYLCQFLEADQDQASANKVSGLAASFATLSTEIQYYLEDLGHQDLSPAQFDRLNRVVYRQQVLDGLLGTLSDLVAQLGLAEGSAGMTRFVNLLRTALETTMMTAQSAYLGGHGRDLERLAGMVGDRSEVLGRMRQAYLTQHVVEDRQERMRLVQLTVTAERIFWALDMLRKTIVSERAAQGANEMSETALSA